MCNSNYIPRVDDDDDDDDKDIIIIFIWCQYHHNFCTC